MIIMSLNFSVSTLMKKDVINIFDSMAGSTSVKPGCKKVNLYSDINNDDDVLLILEWNSHKEMEKHIRSEEFRKIMVLMDLSNEAPIIRFNTVSSTMGFELVEKIGFLYQILFVGCKSSVIILRKRIQTVHLLSCILRDSGIRQAKVFFK